MKSFGAFLDNTIAQPLKCEDEVILAKVISSNRLTPGTLIMYSEKDAKPFKFHKQDYNVIWNSMIFAVEMEDK